MAIEQSIEISKMELFKQIISQYLRICVESEYFLFVNKSIYSVVDS